MALSKKEVEGGEWLAERQAVDRGSLDRVQRSVSHLDRSIVTLKRTIAETRRAQLVKVDKLDSMRIETIYLIPVSFYLTTLQTPTGVRDSIVSETEQEALKWHARFLKRLRRM